MNTTLPTDSNERKGIPLYSGLLKYFPAALATVARISKEGNDKHNPGEPMHHSRGKSNDHSDCILRHLSDVADLVARIDRGSACHDADDDVSSLRHELGRLCWRALAFSQELHERFGAPLAPGAVLPTAPTTEVRVPLPVNETDRPIQFPEDMKAALPVPETASPRKMGMPPEPGVGCKPLRPCRSPYCECDPGRCSHPGCYDARSE